MIFSVVTTAYTAHKMSRKALRIASKGLVNGPMTFLTLDPTLKNSYEPR